MPSPSPASVAIPVATTVALERQIPLPESLNWLGDVIGQLTEGHIYLLAGAPGSAKSRLATQVGAALSDSGSKIGFVLTEENESRLRNRLTTLLAEGDAAHAADVISRIVVDDTLASMEFLPEFVARHVLSPSGKFFGVRVLIIDSLMGHGLPATSASKWARLFDGLRLCRQAGVTVLAVAHVNKANAMAGPRTLAHNCDAVLVLRQLGTFRLLYAAKNRTGPADPRRPVKLSLNPVTLGLEPAPLAETQVVSARSYAIGLGVLEVQSAVSLSLGSRRRIVGSSLPRREIEQLLDTIGQVPGIELNDLDFSVSCRMPGVKGYWPTLGLPLAMSLIGSALQRTIPSNLLYMGEIDLLRNIRDVPEVTIGELVNATTNGTITSAINVICSPHTAGALNGVVGVTAIPCRTLDEAIFATWKSTH